MAAKKSPATKSPATKKAATKAPAKKVAAKAAKKGAAATKGAAKKSAPARKAAGKTAPARKAAGKTAPARKAAKRSVMVAKGVPGVPAGQHTITANLVYKDAAAALDWYAKAFGAKEISRMAAPDGKSIWHAEIQIGDSMLFLNDESPMGSAVAPSGPRTTTATLQLYVSDTDAWTARAVAAGATLTMPVSDMFWGDRMGAITDPFGHTWMIATRVREMSHEEMAAAGAEFAKQFAQKSESQPAQS